MTDEVLELESIESIESALRATESVGSIVGALWALARAQLPRVEATIDEAGAYLEGLGAVIDRVVGPPIARAHADQLHVILGPERSLCGTLATRILEQIPDEGALGLVGARLVERAESVEALRRRRVFSIRGAASAEELGYVAEQLAERVLESADESGVRLLYPQGDRASLRAVVLLSDRAGVGPTELDHFSPLVTIAADAVHELLEGHLHVGLANAWGTEVRWRIAATERAKQAIDERRGELETAHRVHLQEEITRELGELTASLLEPPPP